MAEEIGWYSEDRVWKRTVGDLNTWAFVRLVKGRYEVATGTNGKPSKWVDYCDASGATANQEYKAKRRATALARKLIKEQKHVPPPDPGAAAHRLRSKRVAGLAAERGQGQSANVNSLSSSTSCEVTTWA